MFRTIIKAAVLKYREEGLRQTIISSRSFISQQLTQGSPWDYQSEQRVDLDKRYKILSRHISSDDSNLLDIGCAEGALTRKFAESGLFCMGIDASEVRLSTAQKRHGSEELITFSKFNADSNNITQIPSFDVILLLTVYHHWCREFGPQKAERMLKTTGSKAGKLFFEPPGEKIESLNFSGSSIDDAEIYYKTYLEEVFDEQVKIEHIGTAEYMGAERTDPLFLIDCSEYSFQENH